MMLVAGGLFMAMGLISGLLLVLEPLNAVPFQPGLLSWVLFPALTLVGYGFILGAARTQMVLTVTRLTGSAMMVLAVIATVSLFLIANSIVKTTHSTLVLWYVLGIGLLLGTAGLALPRAGKV